MGPLDFLLFSPFIIRSALTVPVSFMGVKLGHLHYRKNILRGCLKVGAEKIFGPEGEEVSGDWKIKLYNEEFTIHTALTKYY